MRIGIFDSGIGGLSVLHRARKMIPNAEFIYYADEKNVPYGEKTPEEIRSFLFEILHFMLGKKVDAIVIACNTATCVLTKEYREQFPIPIIGMEPAVKKAVDLYSGDNKRILVAATPITIQGKKLNDLVLRCDTNQEVDLIALPGLVRLAERGDFTSAKIAEYLKKELEPFNLDQYGTVVLGCTHFNYFKKFFQNIFGSDIHFLDGNEGTIRQLIRVMAEQNLITDQDSNNVAAQNNASGKVTYYFSGAEVSQKDLLRIGEYMKQLDLVYTMD